VISGSAAVAAKQAISSYRKAVGEPAGLAEYMVFYCERAAGSAATSCIRMMATSMHWSAMFEQALKAIAQLSASDRHAGSFCSVGRLVTGW
jgi:hypothetical protein